MKGEMFDELDLQVLRLAAGKNGGSLAGAVANWKALVTHLKGVDWVFTGGGNVQYGGSVRVPGSLSGVPGIVTLANLHSTRVLGTIWTEVDGLCSTVMGRFVLRHGEFSIENHVLDFVLEREKL